MKKYTVLLWLVLTFCGTYAQKAVPENSILDLSPAPCGEVIKHSYYELAYSEKDEQAFWVYYVLTPKLLAGAQSRDDNFREDKAVRTGSATLVDYSGSGYDRGHLCPAGDMVFNATAMSESFYLSNMSPQDPSFNRGIWKKLESQVREWGRQPDGVYIATGGVLSSNKGHIGPNHVAVPNYYYKVVYSPGKGMIGFVLPNEKSSQSLSSFVVSVDSVEQLTGLDFFVNLPDALENRLEKTVDISAWELGESASSTTAASKSKPEQAAAATQCQGKTKAGSRCKRRAESGSKYCWQHKP